MSDDRIKVLRVITRLNVGGPARQIDSLIEYLETSKFEQVIIFGSVAEGEAEHPLACREGSGFRRIPELGRSVSPISDVRAFIRLVQEIRREKPEVIHTHLAKAGVIGRLAGWVCRVPVRVHTFHGHLLSGYFTGFKLRLYITVERLLRRITTHQICVGARVRQDLIKAGIADPDRSTALSPGIKSPVLSPREMARQSLGVAEEETVILFAGRLVEIKRLDRFVRAIDELASIHPTVKAVVVGDGPARASAMDLIQHADNFLFLGWRDDLGPLYSAADIVCLTSDNEGMPIALIEAALSGVPAVTTDAGSAREVVKHGVSGLVVPIEDLDGLVEALRTLTTDADRRKLYGNAAREFATATFGGRRLAADHEQLYDMLVRTTV